MSNNDRLLGYGARSIANIIPLDEQSCKEIVNYCLSLSSDKLIQDHLIDILGVNSDSLSFIEEFLRLKNDTGSKAEAEKEPATISYSNLLKGDAREVAKPIEKQNQVRSKPKTKTKSSITTSQLLEKSPAPVESKEIPKKKRVKNLNNLRDIEAALNELEISSFKTSSETNRICNCLATRHPLFELAPNCLNCGKIICVKEGFQPCSFCGANLLSYKERNDMKQALEHERDSLLKKTHPESESPRPKPSGKSKKIVISLNSGENLWKAQDKAFKQVEEEHKKNKEVKQVQDFEDESQFAESDLSPSLDPDLVKANERLETLLEFQETGAERTKIIDNAADFESPHTGSAMWLSPMQRALQLKVWQKQLKSQEASKNERTGRGDKSIEMVIKDGKIQMVEKYRVHKEPDNSDIKELEKEIQHEKSKNEIQSLTSWDFEKDKNRWQKPVYASANQVASKDDIQDQMSSRVQFETSTNSEELLVSLPS
ncbi:putative zinc finger motif, C2HC5-type-domain-containing protein [Scheffersomyces coipomensis]|uniref:putative zinc finger motif, C2HC5-type-domain-containing protein n=1 Tax=Scheffersomyces coipomensis TaxID=1788519 RepID=UPI00315C5132